MDIPRDPPNPERDEAIKARQDLAGRAGFTLGCIASLFAIAINLYRSPAPYTFLSIALAVLMATLNIPIGIMLGLAGEKLTRPKHLRPPPKGPPKRPG